jgi:hypothetical protein
MGGYDLGDKDSHNMTSVGDFRSCARALTDLCALVEQGQCKQNDQQAANKAAIPIN